MSFTLVKTAETKIRQPFVSYSYKKTETYCRSKGWTLQLAQGLFDLKKR